MDYVISLTLGAPAIARIELGAASPIVPVCRKPAQAGQPGINGSLLDSQELFHRPGNDACALQKRNFRLSQ